MTTLAALQLPVLTCIYRFQQLLLPVIVVTASDPSVWPSLSVTTNFLTFDFDTHMVKKNQHARHGPF